MKLLAPNGKPSNLTPEQYKLVRSDAFIAWFGDWINSPETASKVVDGNGEPLVVFHGTTSDFNIFSFDKVGSGTKANLGNLGIFFTEDKTLATDFTRKKWTNQNSTFKKGARVVEVFLKIKKPKYMTIDGFILMDNKNRDKESVLSVRKDLLKKGYDGIIVEKAELYWQSRMREFDGKQYVILENNKNIKLADGTNTKFDGSNPDIRYKNGGYVRLSKTPAPKKERIYGSKVNKPKSSESKSKASSIILSPSVIKSINTILKKHNSDYPNKKIPLATAKAVVRRGMGAYSSTHRPTIKGGKPNSRVAWGLARLNAFVYKIQKGHSKSGKYSQDNDLINELGYRISKFDGGGNIESLYKDHHEVWAESEKIIKDVCEENCSKYSDKIYHLYELELKPHFEEEENDFFPKALNDTNKKAIEDLIKEHKTIADLCKTIRLHKKTSDIKLFCTMIIEHIKKEEQIMNKITPDPYKKEENKDYKYFLVLKNKKPIFKVKFSKYNKETERDMSNMLDKLHDMNYMLKRINEKEYNDFDYSNVNKEDIAEFTKNWSFYKEGGVITDEQEETYQKWKKLVNMTPSELKKFLDSEDGKVAGLTSKEADELGIDYGRESAKWILKMKAIPHKEWTPNMWRWANKQISFISRMTGNKGKLYDEKGNRTRKYLSLLVWGNNPLKK